MIFVGGPPSPTSSPDPVSSTVRPSPPAAAGHRLLPESLSLLRTQKVQWASRPGNVPRADVSVQLGRVDRLVPEQHLDRTNVGATLEKMGGERVTKHVRLHPLLATALLYLRL